MSTKKRIKGVLFRQVPDFPPYYVSKDGIVVSYYKRGARRLLCDTPYRLMARLAKRGYPVVTLCWQGVQQTRYIHHLVLEAFVGKRPHGMECRHLDGNRQNSHLTNLVWDTHAANARDMVRHGRCHLFWHDHRGERHPNAKLTDQNVRAIRRAYSNGQGVVKLAARYAVDRTTIYRAINRTRWTHVI